MAILQLTFSDTIEYIKKIPNHKELTLIGGQALCFWYEYYSDIYDDVQNNNWLISTADIDFMANQETLRQCANAWNAKSEIPTLDSHTPNSGIVLIDHDGQQLRIDFLWNVQGLTKTEVEVERLEMLIYSDDNEKIPFYILSPYLCLVSRISNILILRRTDIHSIEQLQASIEVVRFHITHLLESENEKEARIVAEKVFKLAKSTTNGIKIFIDFGINIFQAIPKSELFTKKFNEERYPRMTKIINDKYTHKINDLHNKKGIDKD